MVEYVREDIWSKSRNRGVHVFHKDRKGRKGGGVALYVRDTLQCYVNNVIKIDDSVEFIWLEVREAARTIVLGVLE